MNSELHPSITMANLIDLKCMMISSLFFTVVLVFSASADFTYNGSRFRIPHSYVTGIEAALVCQEEGEGFKLATVTSDKAAAITSGIDSLSLSGNPEYLVTGGECNIIHKWADGEYNSNIFLTGSTKPCGEQRRILCESPGTGEFQFDGDLYRPLPPVKGTEADAACKAQGEGFQLSTMTAEKAVATTSFMNSMNLPGDPEFWVAGGECNIISKWKDGSFSSDDFLFTGMTKPCGETRKALCEKPGPAVKEQLTCQISADNVPIKLFVEGKETPLANANIWYQAKKVQIDGPAKGSCTTVAVSFTYTGSGAQWIKGVCNNGDETDSTWKCSGTAPAGWEQPDFDDSTWDYASVDALGKYDYFWQGDSSFHEAPLIWYYNNGTTGPRYCRGKICNKCKEYKCYSCEDNNPCNPLKTSGVYVYPHHNPDKLVQCTKAGRCFEGSSGKVITAYISADSSPKVFIDGVETPLMNSQYWANPGKLNLGNVAKGKCVTLAVSYTHPSYGGWVKGFTDGESTDSTWKCSASLTTGWETPNFNVSNWGTPAEDYGPNTQWQFAKSSGPAFLGASTIGLAGSEGPRYCRKDICNK